MRCEADEERKRKLEPPKVVYLAGRYSMWSVMRSIRDQLADMGIATSSRWIDHFAGAAAIGNNAPLPKSFEPQHLNRYPEQCSPFGVADLEDIDRADMLVAVSTMGGKGGRHVELGYAIGKGKQVAIIGTRENVFHTLPFVVVHASINSFIVSMRDGVPPVAGDSSTDAVMEVMDGLKEQVRVFNKVQVQKGKLR